VCLACREAHATAQRLLDALRQRVAPTLPAELAQRITTRVLADQVRQRFRRRLLTGAGLTTAALAASVLLALWLAPPSPTPSTPGSGRPGTVAVEKNLPGEAGTAPARRAPRARGDAGGGGGGVSRGGRGRGRDDEHDAALAAGSAAAGRPGARRRDAAGGSLRPVAGRGQAGRVRGLRAGGHLGTPGVQPLPPRVA